jgi:putative ABC transport system permease protein
MSDQRESRAFRALLRLLPFEFRDTFGREMTRTFRDQQREAAHEGTMSILRLWLDTIRGIFTTAPGQHLAIMQQDIAYAIRMMRAKPAFTIVALLTLVIAIAANTAIFSIVYTVLLKPFPFAEPERVVFLWERNLKRGDSRSLVSPPNFLDWRAANHADANGVFTQMAAVTENSLTLADETGRGPMRVDGFNVSGEFFDVLGVPPQLGRLFRPEDERIAQDAAPPIVLSHGFWLRRFGGRADIINTTMVFDERLCTIIGVLPEWFRYVDRGDVWTPFVFSPDMSGEAMRGARFMRVVARVKPGIPLTQADERFGRMVQGLADQRKTRQEWNATLLPLREAMSQFRPALWLLMGAVGFVLLIACANLASLLLARTVSRREEMAVRAALGAGHARLFRQLLTESLVLGLIAGVLGALLAQATLKPLARLAPEGLPRLEDIALDWHVLAFTFGISLLTGLLFGLAPAVRVSAANLFDVLRGTGRDAGTGRRSRVLRNPLVAAQICLTLVLLVGATLMVRSFVALQQVSLGMDPKNVLTHFVSASTRRYPSNEHLRTFADELLQRISLAPGVKAAALDVNLPISASEMSFSFSIDKRATGPNERMVAQFHVIGGDYFRALEQPVRSGRTFDPRDTPASPPVVIINEMMARKYWPGANPIGEHISFSSPHGQLSREIVGVVADVKHANLAAPSGPEIYVPQPQYPWRFTNIVLRTDDAHAATLPAAVRELMAREDPTVPFDKFVWMDQLRDKALAPPRFLMMLLGFFAIVALLLSLICIYGVMSYAVSLRVNELGVRMALGAAPRDLIWLVVRDAMVPALAGAAIGLIASAALANLLRAQFSVIDATDPVTLAMVTLLLIVAALLACYLPARRATKVDPLITLRA